MDTLTQAALGAAVGGAVMGRRLGCRAVLLGAALGTLPDLDVLIDYGDAVADYTYHRGFSHSLFLLAALATLLAWGASRLSATRAIPFTLWWCFFGLCLLTHPLLDALTTYGTQIWWPLPVRPSAWPIVFIIDPLYSLPLMVGVGLALAGRRVRRACAWGVSLSGAYLLFALSGKTLVETRLMPVLAEHGLLEASRLVQPTPFNTLVWRVTVIDGDAHYETLVGLLDGDVLPRLERFSRGSGLREAALATPAGRRLAWFSAPFLRYESREIDGTPTLVATDLRLGFPGFHSFAFSLARQTTAGWQALPSRQLEPPERDNGRALWQLARRAFGAESPLCLSAFVDPRWVVGAHPCPVQ